MLTALLRWMNQSRKDQRKTSFGTSRQHQSPEELFRFACDSFVPHSLRQMWQGEIPSRTLFLEAFEDRVLFSAAPAPAPAPVEVVVVAPLQADASTIETVPPATPETASDGAATDTTGILASVPGTSDSEQSTAATLVVVDPSVPDYESLLDQLLQQQSGRMKVLVLDSQRDGLEQIAERLEQLGQTRAIHILSHGDEAGLHLGSNWLSADTIAMRANTLAQWQPMLTADADVLFYGCDLAANATGQEFLRTFGQLTGADVGASTDATGAALLGGDWNLEFQSGSVETRSLGESMNLFEWNGLLTTNTYQQGVSSYTGTQDTTVNASTPGTVNGTSSSVSIGGASAKTGLIRFDNLFGSGPGQIPVGSTIHSASLRLNVTTGTMLESTITLHRVLANWSEASTWNTLGSGLTRDDVEVATVADSLVGGTTATGFQTITGLEESLQAWSDGEANSGWALFGDNASGWTFTSSEGATLSQRPMLIVDFTPPTPPPAGELLAAGETRVNVSTTDIQSTATNSRNSHDAVGVDANGNYVIVWTSHPSGPNGTGVYGQRFNSRGLPQGGEFQINQVAADNQQWASVAMKSDGGFIVTWTSQNQDGGGQGGYARIYTAAGVGGTEFRVNTTTTGTQQASAIGVAADGTFVIAWEGNGSGDSAGIYAQRFDATGSQLGGEIRVNTTTANTQYDPAIAVGPDGQFMVVWDDVVGTHGRRFQSNGTALDTNQILLHSDITSGNADVATNGTGDYHVVWRTTGGGDGSGRAIWRMSLASTDMAATALFQVPANSINDQTEPAITSNGDGDFIVTWQGAGPGDTAGVFARKFLSDGTAVGTEFQLNETVSGSQIAVSAAIVDLDNFVTVWSGNGPGDATGVFSRVYGTMENRSALLFTTNNNVTASGNSDLAAWTTGDVVSFQQPNLILGDNTTGTLGIVGHLNASNDGGVKLEGLDFIQSDVLVGRGANAIQLYAGDVLFSVSGTESFGPLTIQSDDIAVFRPAAPWNYSAGSIFVLLDGVESVAGGAIQQRADFDLVDRDTQVGDVLLRAGDLVIGDTGGAGNAIHVFQATGAGNGTTSGTAYTLLDAAGMNLGHKIQGVHLIERDVRIGATTLHSGELLLSTDQSTTLGGNSLAVTANDVVRLWVDQTSVNGPASTTASIAIDGSDLALDTSLEALKSLAFASVGTPPTVNDDTYHLTEDEAFDSANLWYDANWSSRMELTFNNASRAENLDDFPILVTLDTNRFDYSLAKANGEDLRLVDANGQLLAHEIETWNPSGRSAIWVKVPRIDASSSTDSIHLYYGNTAAADIQNSTAVWSNGYVGVWHLNGDPSGTQTIADSSSSNVDGTSIGLDATNQVSGPIGGALKFNGMNEAIRVATTSSDPTAVDQSALTIEAWANSTGDSGVAERIINRRNLVFFTPYESYGLATSADNRTQVVNSTGTPDLTGTVGSLPEDRWRYLTGVLSGSTSSLYMDGVLNATQTGVTSLGSNNDDITIGAGEMGLNSTLSQFWTGGIDEVRLSNVARSAAWTAAQYASMTDTLITYGERQTVAGLLDNDQSATTGGLIVSSVDLSDLTGVATATVLDDGQVSFVPGASYQSLAAGQTVTKEITYTAIDQNGNTDTATATFVIHGANDAPVISTVVGPLTLTSVDEGSTNPAGNTVQSILTSAGGTLITDVDSGAVPGIAVTAVDTANGTWQYSLDGTTWSSLTGVSDTNATLLDTASRVRFVPTAGFSGTAGAITFRAWDQTTGTNAQSGVNVSTNGGSTAFSAQTTTASITVIPFNTAPVLVINTGLTVLEGNAALLSSSKLTASDAENTPSQLIYTLSALPTNGRLERVATPGVAITTFTQADLNSNAIRYVHNGSETTLDSFNFSLSDGAATLTGSFAISVSPLNDAPVVGVNTGLTVAEGGSGLLTSTTLSTSDSDNTSAQLTYTVTTFPTNGRVERVSAAGAAITTFTQTDLNSNAIRYVHNGGETTFDGFSFSLSDGTATVTGSFAITVTSVNDAPVITLNTGPTVVEGGNGLLTSTRLSASDPDNSAAQLTYTISTIPVNGRVERVAAPGVTITTFTQAEINSNAIRYVHDGGETTSDGFSFTLSDGAATVTGSIAITVTPGNDAPIVSVNTGLSMVEGGSSVLTSTKLSASDSDNSAAQLVYTVSTSPANGRVERVATPGIAITTFTQAEINSNAIRYVHDGGETIADGLSFSLSDGTATVTGTFSITVTPINDAPVMTVNAGLFVVEGGNGVLTSTKLSVIDPDNTAAQLMYTITTSPANGRVERVAAPGTAITSFTQADINSNAIQYVHDGGETTSDSFSFTLSDGTATVTGSTALTVTPVNDAPVLSVNTGLTVVEGGNGVLTSTKLATSDPDNTAAQRVFTVTASPSHGRLEKSSNPGVAITSFSQANINSGVIRYVHDGGETTSDSFSFSLSDGTASVTGSFSFTITAVNDAPVMAANLGISLLEGGSQLIGSTRLEGADADNSPSQLIYTVATSPANGRLERTAAPGVAITTFTQADLNSNTIRYVHNGGETTSDSLSFSLSDGAATVTGSFAITITPVNDTPVMVVNTGLIASEGGNAVLSNTQLLTSDVDNTPSQLAYSLTTSPTNGQLERVAAPGTAITSFTQSEINSGAIRYVHDGSETTSDSFSFSLSDGAATVSSSLSITVTPVNNAPSLVTNQMTIAEGQTLTLSSSELLTTDTDTLPASLTYTVTVVTNGRFEFVASPGTAITVFTQDDINSSRVRFVHSGGEAAPAASISVSDGTDSVGPTAVLITFTNVNDAPTVTTNTGMTLNEGAMATLSNTKLATSDPDNTAAQRVFTVTSNPAYGRLETTTTPGIAITSFTQAQINSGIIRYVHDGGESTADSFSFSLSDGTASVTGSFALTITPANDTPVLSTNAGVTLTEGGVTVFGSTQLAASDADNAAFELVYTVVATPVHGRLERVAAPGTAITSFTQADLDSSAIRYVHDGGETTSDGFGFSLSDGNTVVTGTFAITVTPVNDTPVIAVNTGLTVAEGGNGVLTSAKLAASDPDNSPSQLIYTVSTSLVNGRLERVATPGVAITTFTQADVSSNAIRYVHNGGETTSDSFAFSLSDGTATVNGSFAITVTPVNDAPVITTNVGLAVIEGGIASISSADLNTDDIETGPAGLTYTVTGGLGFGHLALAFAPGSAITSFTQAQINGNQIVYVHEGAESTADSFTFSVSDGALATTGTMSITITAVNDAPVFDTSRMILTEGQRLTLSDFNLLTNDNDTPATALIYTVNSVTSGRFESALAPGVAVTSFSQDDITHSRVVFVHDGGEAAPTATLTVTDGVSSVGPNSLLMTFSNANDPPVITANTGVTLNEGATATIGTSRLATSDPDNTPVQRVYTVTTSPSHGRLEMSNNPGVSITSFTQADINGELIRYVHDGSETTSDEFSFSVTDGVATVTGSFVMTVTPVNNTPVFANHLLAITEGQPVTLSSSNLLTYDSDTPVTALVYSVTAVSHGRFEYTASPGTAITTFTQEDINLSRVRFVHDGTETTPTASVSVTDGITSVGPNSMLMTFSVVNDVPTITTNTGMRLGEGTSGGISSAKLNATDSDNAGIELVYTITTSPVHGQLEDTRSPGVAMTSFTQASLNDGFVRYFHDGGETTSDSFTYSLSDGSAAVTGTFGIAITPLNDAPTLTSASITVSEGQAVTLTLAHLDGSDVDSGSLTFSVSGVSRGQFKVNATGLSVTSFTRTQVQAGQIRFVHDGSEDGPLAAVSVSDGVSPTTPVAITFAFSNVNDAPIAQADPISTSIGSSIVLSPSILLANDSDAEHDLLTISITRQPDHGTLVTNLDGTYAYRPDLGYSGNDSFEYVVSDGNASSTAAVVSFNVAVLGPSTLNSSVSTSSSSDSRSTTSGTTDGDSGTTSQASSGTTTSTTSGSPIALSPGGSLAGSNTNHTDTEVFAFLSNTHDEDGLGLFLARQRNSIDEVTRSVRTPQSLDGVRPNSRSGEQAIGSLDSLLTGGQLAQLNYPTSSTLTQFRTILGSDANLNAFADVTKSLQSDLTSELVFEIPALAGASLTVGYVVWMLRGGLLITSLLAQVPAWSIVDPLAVLDSLDKSDEDNESIGSLVEQGQSELEPVM